MTGAGATHESAIANNHKAAIHQHINGLITEITTRAKAQAGPCHVLIMSNGGFAGIHDKLLATLEDTLVSA